jgi:RNA polymerase sigma-70 factor (ECF subfamily)
MTGSALDGEDVVQEALFHAYRRLDTFDDTRPLAPWLFRIAHNRCIDLLRRRGVREEAEAAAAAGEPDVVAPVDPPGPALGRAVERLVAALPPMERACVLLKDVFDYTLEDIAPVVDSSIGGVKAALNRGRRKLAVLPPPAALPAPRPRGPDADLLRLYVDRFNARDWDGVRALIAADARLQVADRFAGLLSESPYFGNYARVRTPWRMAAAAIDGEATIAILGLHEGAWRPHAAVRLEVDGDLIVRIADFGHIPWILDAAETLILL